MKINLNSTLKYSFMVIKELSDKLKKGNVNRSELASYILDILKRLEELEDAKEITVNEEIKRFFQ